MTIGQQVADFANGRVSFGFSPAMLLDADTLTPDIDIIRTMNVVYESMRCTREWKPVASTVQSRLRIQRKAHDYVDFWKVGKLNHNKAVEQSALGPKFRAAATAADSYCGFDDRQVAVVGEEMVKYPNHSHQAA